MLKGIATSFTFKERCHVKFHLILIQSLSSAVQKELSDVVGDIKPTCTHRILANIRVLLLDDIS